MVQTVCSYKILAGKKRIVLEKPHTLRRIFFRIARIDVPSSWSEMRLSFDDPQFHSYYMLKVAEYYFSSAGADIFQGDVWALNVSAVDLWCVATEILR